MNIRVLSAIFAATLCCAIWSHVPAAAAVSKDPDWPCIQPKVPKITAGMMWAGPPVNEDDRSWEKSPEVSELVKQLASRRLPIEKADKLIADFAARQQSDKNQQLTLLFTGLLQTINQERAQIIAGIARYARQQRMRADRIRELREEITALYGKNKLSEQEQERRDKLEEQINWETRIFDERAQSLTYVCESPRILEQRLFALARTIQQYLE